MYLLMKTIRITDGKTTIRAVLNGTMAAKDLEKRLPFECSGSDSGIDFCCPIPRGIFDPVECQTGWKNGDICLLSPAAASYDQYKNFEERGRLFKDLSRSFLPVSGS